MGWEAWYSLVIVLLVLGLMACSRLPADLALLLGLVALVLPGVLSPADALSGFANEGMITVAVLYVVGAGIRQTGGVDWIVQGLFGRPRSAFSAMLRLMLPTAAFSAVMNNTPLVAMLIPAVADWSRKTQLAASKLMLPLSYAAILGGTMTLIGTSTNLVVDGKVRELSDAEVDRLVQGGMPEDQARAEFARRTGLPARGLRLFDITWVGLPATVVGIAWVVFTHRWLLPDRKPAISQQDDPREYTAEMLVPADSPLVGKTIEAAGLRHLPGAYLAEIDRGGIILPAVSPEERLWANDRLVFVGILETVADLQKMRGLIPATDQVFKLTAPRSTRCLIEAVVSDSCPLVGQTIRDGRFRSVYNAVVIAAARNGERLRQKLGDVVLKPGDTLLLEAHPSFVERQRNSRDFFLVSQVEDSAPRRHERALLAMLILLGMVTAVAVGPALFAHFGWPRSLEPTMLKAAVVAAALLMATRCLSIEDARRSIDWSTLLAIAASFGIGRGVEQTGAAHTISNALVGLAQGSPWATLALVYLVTLLLTEIITNNAAAALMFPFAVATAQSLGVNYMPFVVSVMMAASAGFATPMGYQTNLMVYGPGGYRFGDYLRLGIPLDIVVGVVTVLLAPLVWPF